MMKEGKKVLDFGKGMKAEKRVVSGEFVGEWEETISKIEVGESFKICDETEYGCIVIDDIENGMQYHLENLKK